MSYVETQVPPSRPNPQKRNLLINRIKRAPWWLLAMILMLIFLYITLSHSPVYRNLWYGNEAKEGDGIVDGIAVTIRVSIRAYALALVMGLILALMRMSRNFLIHQTSTFYVELIRGIPTLVLVFYVAVGLPPKITEGLNQVGNFLVEHNLDYDGKGTYLAEMQNRDLNKHVSAEYRAVAALAISYSAFLSEIFRAGIQSVHSGQIEAAKSLGLSRSKTFLLIMLPQAFRTVLPPLGNDFIAMLKESSLVSVLGVADLTKRGQIEQASSFRVFEIFNTVALTYLSLTLVLSIIVKAIEWHLDEKQPKPAWYEKASRQAGRLLSLELYQDLFVYVRRSLFRRQV